jgi:hypothetical protein
MWLEMHVGRVMEGAGEDPLGSKIAVYKVFKVRI